MVGSSELKQSGIERPVEDINFEKTAAFYELELQKRTKGPQLEGLTSEWLQDALYDTRTKLLDLGNGIAWPVFIPIEHNHDYRTGFFEDHFPDRAYYYYSAPPDNMPGDISKFVADLKGESAIVAYDYMVGGDSISEPFDGYDFVYDVTPESFAFGQFYGLPRANHFSGVARIVERVSRVECNPFEAFARLVDNGKYESSPYEGPVVLDPKNICESPELMDDIWSVFKAQFDELVEDHPALQSQPREELESMLSDEDSFNLAYFQEGKIVALCYFVSNIDKVVWLNGRFFDDLRSVEPDARLTYFPGIVVDSRLARKDGGYVGAMISLLQDTCREAGIKDFHITFQCTNVSETYVPKIVANEIAKCGIFELDNPVDDNNSFTKIAQYEYRIASFGNIY